MEKSIEAIWKEGFLKNDALVAPKLNDLYNQKSLHIIEKFKRMFRINLLAIAAGASVFWIFTYLQGFPVMGIGVFLTSCVIVIVNKRLSNGLEKIDKNVSSYQYLKDFDRWMKEQLSVNRRMARYYYPLFFLSMALGFWFSPDFQNIIMKGNEIYWMNGIPVFWTISIILISGLLAFFGGRIYNWDVGLVYGHIFKKLEEIIADMEELRK